MARTPSTMLPLGTKAPEFTLLDASGKMHSYPQENGKILLVMFLCNHCPFVKHLEKQIAAIFNSMRSIDIVAINSNDYNAYPEDSPEKMRAAPYEFPYLVDENQNIAKAFHAACTPDFFLFDASHELIYRGQFDDSRPSNREPITGRDLLRAIELAQKNGIIPDKEQTPSLGCNIKWKPGNEPDYFR